MDKKNNMVEILSCDQNKITVIVKENNRLFTASEVGKKWGCDPNYVRDLYRHGLLKGIKFTNRTVKFRKEEIESFEKWAEDKDLADLDNITDIRTGANIFSRF